MLGRITYTVTLAGTPQPSPLTVANFEALQNIEAITLAAGSTQDIYLYWGYTSNDPYYTDVRNVSRSAAGVVEITNFGSTNGFKLVIDNIIEDRAAQVNEYAIMNALNAELMAGTVVSWYPNYDSFPAEFFSCISAARLAQKRTVKNRWQFTLDLQVLPIVQLPSSVPAFQIA